MTAQFGNGETKPDVRLCVCLAAKVERIVPA